MVLRDLRFWPLYFAVPKDGCDFFRSLKRTVLVERLK